MPDLGESVTRFQELFFEQKELKSIAAGNNINNAVFLAKWQIIKQGDSPDGLAYIQEIVVSSVMRVDSGGGNIRFGVIISDDNSTWGTITGGFNSHNNPTPTAKISNADRFSVDVATKFIAIAAFNTDGATEGSIERFLGHFILNLPNGDNLARLL